MECAAERPGGVWAILRDPTRQSWALFSSPVKIVRADRIADVLPCIGAAEVATKHGGLHAVGLVGYESAPAFDPALTVRPAGDFPLAWFAIFDEPEYLESVQALSPEGYHIDTWEASVTREHYAEAFGRIKEFIAAGATYQVNYTVRFRTRFAGDPLGLFAAVHRAQPGECAAYIDMGDYAVCSCSPEVFFLRYGTRLTCRPMKGTAPRGKTPADDRIAGARLRESEKNRAENLMIVDMVRNDLGRIARIGTVRTAGLFDIERYPTLWQMTSEVTAESDAPLSGVLGALFPCASITGAPKVQTMRIIAELENAPRHLYTGCIGWVRPGGDAHFSVAIRTAVVDRRTGTAEYGAGGGVVWDSLVDEEFAECRLKACAVTKGRPHFELLETMLWRPGEGWFLLDYHLRRLRDSAEYFGYVFNRIEIEKRLDAVAAGPAAQRVRLRLSQDGAVAVETSALDPPDTAVVRLRLARRAIDSSDIFLYHKTTYREAYERARGEVGGCDDVLLWNERGELTETSVANVVVERDGALWTPPVDAGLLGGTYRAWLLDNGTIRERRVPLDFARGCDRFYVVNSVRGMREASVTW